MINIEPISLNNSQKITTRGKFARKYKTKEAIKFENEFLKQFDYYIEQFFKFAALQNELECPIHSTIRIKKPIYKKGTVIVSKTSIDLDNAAKPIHDLICDAISVNDAFITRLVVEKIHSLVPQIEIEFNLVES